MAVARGLRESKVEAASPGAGNMGHHAIEYLSVPLVLVEPVIQIRAQESAALRNTEADRAVNGAGGNRPGVRRGVLQHRDRVADGSWADADKRRILRFV